MDMKKILKSTACLTSVLLLAACTKGFEQMNQDIYNPSDKQMAQDGLAVGGMFQALQRSVFVYDENRDSDYQIAYNLCADTWAGYSTPTQVFSAGHFHDSWDFCDQWCSALFDMKNTKAMGSFNNFMENAQKLGMTNEMALATIIKVASMHQVADYYGPIAYSSNGSLKNNYDPLDQVYKQLFQELDASIETLETLAATGASLLTNYDLVYGGNVTQWVRFANSLRLRLAMRVRYADAELARTEAEKSVNSLIGLIESNLDNAVLSDGNAAHFLLKIGQEFNDGDAHVGASMDSYLNGYDDPRKFKFFNAAGDGNLHGVLPGINKNSYAQYKNTPNKVSSFNAGAYKITWMNAAEVAFLRAEGALAGWDMGGSAKDFYEEGIKLSFEEWGVDGAASYAANSTAKPADFRDAVERNHKTAPATVTIAWNEKDGIEAKLEKIGTQKWIALFPNGAEAWAEQRRLHYPVLLAPKSNKSGGTVVDSQGPRRCLYPENEKNTNPEGYASGVAALGGAENAGVRLWWDKKPFNN